MAGLSSCPNERTRCELQDRLPISVALGARTQLALLCNGAQCLIDLKRWPTPSGRLATEHTRTESIGEDVYADCPPYWLHPEYQSAAAAAGRRPSGRSRQLSAGACPLSGRREGVREGGEQEASKRVWLWALLTGESHKKFRIRHIWVLSSPNKHLLCWASWWPFRIHPSAVLACQHSRSLRPVKRPYFLTEMKKMRHKEQSHLLVIFKMWPQR